MKKIVLASGSPRRRFLLRQAGVSFRVIPPDVPEILQLGETPAAFVRRLSQDKAKNVGHRLKKGLVLAADTIVVSPRGKVLGKPKSKKEAIRMVSQLAGRTHTVLTGYCLLEAPGRVIRKKVVSTRVKIRKLTRAEILAYVERGESMDKAGAYAAQGFGSALVEKLVGSYTNVVGLPLSEVVQDLEDYWKT